MSFVSNATSFVVMIVVLKKSLSQSEKTKLLVLAQNPKRSNCFLRSGVLLIRKSDEFSK